MMKTRRLGELEVGAIGLGCMSMSGSYGPTDTGESEATLERAQILDAETIVFRTAPDFSSSEANRNRLRAFFAGPALTILANELRWVGLPVLALAGAVALGRRLTRRSS